MAISCNWLEVRPESCRTKSSGERAQWVPFSLLFVCQTELTENSPSLPQNSVSSLLRNSTHKTVTEHSSRESLNGGLANRGWRDISTIVHDCLQLSSFCDASSPLKGPHGKRPQICTFVDASAQTAESGLKPIWEPPFRLSRSARSLNLRRRMVRILPEFLWGLVTCRSFLQLPSAVVLNPVGRREHSMSAKNANACQQKSAKGRKRAQRKRFRVKIAKTQVWNSQSLLTEERKTTENSIDIPPVVFLQQNPQVNQKIKCTMPG